MPLGIDSSFSTSRVDLKEIRVEKFNMDQMNQSNYLYMYIIMGLWHWQCKKI